MRDRVPRSPLGLMDRGTHTYPARPLDILVPTSHILPFVLHRQSGYFFGASAQGTCK